jgi:dynein heavy chain
LAAAPPIPRDIPVNQIIVPTVETIRNITIMQLLVQHQKAMMIIGPTGTGKSSYVTVRFPSQQLDEKHAKAQISGFPVEEERHQHLQTGVY